MNTTIDGAGTALSSILMAWIERHVAEEKRDWVRAMTAELQVMESGWQRAIWAIGGLSLLWSFRPGMASGSQLVINGSAFMLTTPDVERPATPSLLRTLILVAVSVAAGILVVPVAMQADALYHLAAPFPARLAIELAHEPLELLLVLLLVGAIIRLLREPIARLGTVRVLRVGIEVACVAWLIHLIAWQSHAASLLLSTASNAESVASTQENVARIHREARTRVVLRGDSTLQDMTLPAHANVWYVLDANNAVVAHGSEPTRAAIMSRARVGERLVSSGMAPAGRYARVPVAWIITQQNAP